MRGRVCEGAVRLRAAAVRSGAACHTCQRAEDVPSPFGARRICLRRARALLTRPVAGLVPCVRAELAFGVGGAAGLGSGRSSNVHSGAVAFGAGR